jgi:hypothetical protein
MFKPANPDLRRPAYLQAHTKENMIWQLKLSGLLLIGFILADKVSELREKKRRKNAQKTDTDLIG